MEYQNYWTGLPARVKVALVVGITGTAVALDILLSPFVSASWNGWAVGAVLAVAVTFLSTAPLLHTLITAALVLVVSFTSWRLFRVGPADAANIVAAVVTGATAAAWVIWSRRRHGVNT